MIQNPSSTELVEPDQPQGVAEVLREAARARTAVFPLGGGSAGSGWRPPQQPGLRLSLAKLNRLVDYPARDLTITVEAGMTVAEVQRQLAANGQRLPVEIPYADRATLGGAVAANSSGPRRYGCGTLRDYLLGLRAVDGCGTEFAAGGRVVKNAAGYDLCKLLIGSWGTLGVITQLTLMVRPALEASVLVACDVSDFRRGEELLCELAGPQFRPVAIELLAGPAWQDDPLLARQSEAAVARLVVGFEAARGEVEGMVGQLTASWQARTGAAPAVVRDDAAAPHWDRLVHGGIPSRTTPPDGDRATNGDAPFLALKVCVKPSAVIAAASELLRMGDGVVIQSHAGNGVIHARLPLRRADDARSVLDRQVRPCVAAAAGKLVVESVPAGMDFSAREVWGSSGDAAAVMCILKQQFDPQGVLNPGRFIFENS
jgi:glycolate oxidase FAD binding subunit